MPAAAPASTAHGWCFRLSRRRHRERHDGRRLGRRPQRIGQRPREPEIVDGDLPQCHGRGSVAPAATPSSSRASATCGPLATGDPDRIETGTAIAAALTGGVPIGRRPRRADRGHRRLAPGRGNVEDYGDTLLIAAPPDWPQWGRCDDRAYPASTDLQAHMVLMAVAQGRDGHRDDL